MTVTADVETPEMSIESPATTDLKEFVADALQARLATDSAGRPSGEPKWMEGFGKLRRLRNETARIQGIIDATFEVVEAEDRL